MEFFNSTKNTKYLRINLTKHVHDLYTKNYKKKKTLPLAAVGAKTPKARLWVPHLDPQPTSKEPSTV